MKQTTPALQNTPFNNTPEVSAAPAPLAREPLLPPKYSAPFIDFKGLHRDVLPFYSARTLRELVRRGIVPSIRLPKARKRAFHIGDVVAALRRHTQGSVE